jgi:hypothetical protein
MQRKFKIGDRVKLPSGETGTIKRINEKTLDWHPYKVQIRNAVFNKRNKILAFREEDMDYDDTPIGKRRPKLNEDVSLVLDKVAVIERVFISASLKKKLNIEIIKGELRVTATK